MEQPDDLGHEKVISLIYTEIDDISRCPRNAMPKLQRIKDMLERIPEEDRLNKLLQEANKRKGETVLHTAIKSFDFKSDTEKYLIEYFVRNFPQLILQDRDDTEYAGQTPLHMAVCKGNIWIVQTMLKELSEEQNRHMKAKLLKKKADGSIFENTVMMGEIPLIIAALTLKKGMFDLLLKYDAELDGVNRYGECVSHALIRYAFLYPEKLRPILKMCKHISKVPKTDETSVSATKNRKLRKKIWVMENEEGLNPLQLAASLGQHVLFGFIMNLEVYRFENSKDGLFDINIYDVTDIDGIASMRSEDITGSGKKKIKDAVPEDVLFRQAPVAKPCTKSVLMMMLELDPKCAFQFIQFPTIRETIDRKWNAYRKVFYPWCFFHFTFICLLTWYSVEKAQHNFNNGTGYKVNNKPYFKSELTKNALVTAFGVITLFVSACYFALEIVRIVKGKMLLSIYSFLYPYGNGSYRVLFMLLDLSLVLDFIISIYSEYYENYFLIFAVIMGWFSIVFFIRVVRPFSFFTVLIQRVLVEDMLRFLVILGIETIAFSTAMYIAIQGSNVIEDQDFSDFGRVLFSLFKLMLGLGEVATLYDTRHPILAIFIFTGFIIITTLLMLNALICMMSNASTELTENIGNISSQNRYCALQRLSVILFIESVLPQRMIVKVGDEKQVLRYNSMINRRKAMKRYMLEVRSLHKKSEDVSNMVSNWNFHTGLLSAVRDKHAVHIETVRQPSDLSNKLKKMFRRKSNRISKGKVRVSPQKKNSRQEIEMGEADSPYALMGDQVPNCTGQLGDAVDPQQTPHQHTLDMFNV